MSRGLAFRTFACAVLLMFLAGNVFAEAAAMLEPNGTVLVNETAVHRISTVFSGDRVRTGAASGAMISGRGGTVLLAANSSLTVGPRTMTLDQGGATMTLAAGQSAQVADLTLTAAADSPASYKVERDCGFVEIEVKSGTVNVTSGGSTTTITAGHSKKFKVPKTAECASAAENDNSGIIFGSLAAVAAGLIIWFSFSETSRVVP